LGYKGILEKIEKARRMVKPVTPDFYDALTYVVQGIQNRINNHVTEARKMAEAETNNQIKAHLIHLIEMNRRIINEPPATFQEACQWIAWYCMAARIYNGSGALGAIDRLLLPFYERDIQKGILNDEEAIFHLACLNVIDPQYMQIGGIDENGKDASNRVSMLVMEAVHRLKIPANVSLGVHANMDQALMDKAIDMQLNDRNGTPRFWGVDNIVGGFQKLGFSYADGTKRTQTGCHWFCVPGREYTLADVIKINFAAVFNVSFSEMMAKDKDKASSELLWDYFKNHLTKAVETVAKGIDYQMRYCHLYFAKAFAEAYIPYNNDCFDLIYF